jgi:TatD DNase family protein
MTLFDAHAHLAAPEFAADLSAVLARAEAAGLCGVLTVGETAAEAHRILALADRHPLVKPAAGVYPTVDAPEEVAAAVALVRAQASRLVALGEVGLDHWVAQDEGARRRQEAVLERFVALSLELELPLNVHSRSAGRRTIDFLQAHGARRVLLHAFDAKASAALEGVRAGYCFSIPPSVVRSPQKQKLVRALPLDSLLLETDSPVLGPDPGRRNEPANLRVACQAVAALKGLPVEEVARATTENARRLFPRAFDAEPLPTTNAGACAG